MKVEIYRFNLFEVNTYVVYDDTKECVIIDPGCYSENERDFFVKSLQEKELQPVIIVNTHCHSDHILGVNFLKEKYNIPFAARLEDNFLLENAQMFAERWHWKIDSDIKIDVPCQEGTIIKFGNTYLKCTHTPGHTPGGQTLYAEDAKIMFTGDTLFKGTIGRTDLEGASYEDEMVSIRNIILRFDSLYEIFPGHGEPTSVGIETTENPFVKIV
ncbi:MAG: MBL fold metallo-hydrolase [Bacteroidales bacterium]|nr:MBL fold metallo-hydrolase [Bacteroidales bacterium]